MLIYDIIQSKLSLIPKTITGTSHNIILQLITIKEVRIMSLGKNFSRSKEIDVGTQNLNNRITCDTDELRDVITDWTKNEGWEFENFADFLELIGVKTPVNLSEYDKKNHSFKCITALNTENHISLYFGDCFNYYSEIRITEGEETRHYITNTNFKSRNTIPEVSLQSRKIKRNGKILESDYCYFCDRTLIIDATHVLKVEIDEPNKHDEKSEIFVLRNCTDIEEYLIGLDNSLIVADVYKKVMELLCFSDEDISRCDKISFSYVETIDKEPRVRSKILLIKGELQEYAILEKGETYHVFKNGSWKYLSDSGISIIHLEDLKPNVFSITGSEESIITVNPYEILKRVKAKISELQKFVK